MSDEFFELVSILEASVKKNGDRPLTTKYLLNTLNMVVRNMDERHMEDDVGRFDVDFYKNG